MYYKQKISLLYSNKLLIMLTVIFFSALLSSVGSILLFITKLGMVIANKKRYNVIDVIFLLLLAVCLWTLFYHLNH